MEKEYDCPRFGHPAGDARAMGHLDPVTDGEGIVLHERKSRVGHGDEDNVRLGSDELHQAARIAAGVDEGEIVCGEDANRSGLLS